VRERDVVKNRYEVSGERAYTGKVEEAFGGLLMLYFYRRYRRTHSLWWFVILAHLVVVWSPRGVLGEWRCVPSAHRGEHTQGFDNSVEAIRGAKGLPYVEIDIRITADNDLILFHDRRLSPTNVLGGGGLVGRFPESLSREEIASIRFPDGSRIPKLRTVLHETERQASTLMLDVKSSSPRDFRRVMGEVMEAKADSRVVVQCQTKGLVEMMRREFPHVAILARAHHEHEVEQLLEHSPQFVQVDYDWNLTSLVPMIHDRGARVVVKTLSKETDVPKVWRTVCEAGIDIVLTDKPREFLLTER
jgi:glycerophosphoryl diester phosphodiesterase